MNAKGLLLTREERDTIKQTRRIARMNHDQDVDLKLTSLLMVADGMVQKDVSEILNVPLRTLESWIEKYRNDGIQGVAKGPYPGRSAKLDEKQMAELAQMIEVGPEESGLDTGVWTIPILVRIVKNRFGVAYSVSGLRKLVHALGFSVQYPTRRLSKADLEQQRTWIREDLAMIKKKSFKTTERCYTKTK